MTSWLVWCVLPTLGVRDSKLTDGKTGRPHHHQSKSFDDPDEFVKSRRQFFGQPFIVVPRMMLE